MPKINNSDLQSKRERVSLGTNHKVSPQKSRKSKMNFANSCKSAPSSGEFERISRQKRNDQNYTRVFSEERKLGYESMLTEEQIKKSTETHLNMLAKLKRSVAMTKQGRF